MVSSPLSSPPENAAPSQVARQSGRTGHALRRLWGWLFRHAGELQPATPAADQRPGGTDMAALGRALQRALDQHPRSRSMLRHLAIFEKAFRRHGAGVLEKLPTSFLYRVSLQLEGIAADEALRRLATVIDQTLGRRTQKAERELAFVSSLEFASQVEVEEFVGDDALREFSMLWKSQSTSPAVAANASRLHPAQDDWPYTQPQLP